MIPTLVATELGLEIRHFLNADDAKRAQAPIESDGIGASFMPVECGWCGVSMGAKVCEPEKHGRVSTSMCAACEVKMYATLPPISSVVTSRQGLGSLGVNRSAAPFARRENAPGGPAATGGLSL